MCPKYFAVKNEFLSILIQAMNSIGENRMNDQHQTVIKDLLQKNLPIDTFEQDLKLAPIWVRKTIWNIAKEIEQDKPQVCIYVKACYMHRQNTLGQFVVLCKCVQQFRERELPLLLYIRLSLTDLSRPWQQAFSGPFLAA